MSATHDIVANYQHIIGELVLIMGAKGAFEVKVDDELIFSKKQLGRHAEPGEVLQLFREVVGQDVPTYPQSN